MVNPTSNWDAVPVFGFYFLDDLTPASGNVKLTVTQRVTRVDGRRIYPEGATITRTIGDTSTNAAVRDAVRDAWRAADQAAQGASFDATAWNAWWNVMLTGAVFASFPANDDPDIVQTGYQVKVEEQLFSGGGREFYIEPTLAALASVPPGINLGMVDVPAGAPLAPAPIYAKGLPGGVAALDAQGDVVDAAGHKVTSSAAPDLSGYARTGSQGRTDLGLGSASTHPVSDFDAAGAATAVQVANRLALVRNPDALITGTIARDANGAATSAPVTWPDGSPGTYTATTVSSAFPGAVDAYTITYGSPVTKTYTQPAITRDPSSGAATNVPAIQVA